MVSAIIKYVQSYWYGKSIKMTESMWFMAEHIVHEMMVVKLFIPRLLWCEHHGVHLSPLPSVSCLLSVDKTAEDIKCKLPQIRHFMHLPFI